MVTVSETGGYVTRCTVEGCTRLRSVVVVRLAPSKPPTDQSVGHRSDTARPTAADRIDTRTRAHATLMGAVMPGQCWGNSGQIGANGCNGVGDVGGIFDLLSDGREIALTTVQC